MLQVEHSAILSTFIKLPFVIKIFVWSIFERPLNTEFTVYLKKDEKSLGHTSSEFDPIAPKAHKAILCCGRGGWWLSDRVLVLESEGSLVRDSTEVLCCVLEQDTLSSA